MILFHTDHWTMRLFWTLYFTTLILNVVRKSEASEDKNWDKELGSLGSDLNLSYDLDGEQQLGSSLW